jgi:hypothetical protein
LDGVGILENFLSLPGASLPGCEQQNAGSAAGHIDRAATSRGGFEMTDVLYLGVVVGFFALTWALIRLCERL